MDDDSDEPVRLDIIKDDTLTYLHTHSHSLSVSLDGKWLWDFLISTLFASALFMVQNKPNILVAMNAD